MIKRGKINKKGQGVMGIPFSIIFSIILIVVFISVAIIAIKVFWNPGGCGTNELSKTTFFKQDFQDKINEAWTSDEFSISGENGFKIELPGAVDFVCFLDTASPQKNSEVKKSDLDLYGDGPVYLYPGQKACDNFAGLNIQHIDIKKVTAKENPLCIENGERIDIEKGFYDSLVTIKKQA